MLLPLFMTCDTLDFSHSIGSVNSPWNAIFIYERYPHGLGFTEKAYELLHDVMPAVLDTIRRCTCTDGCPCCVGKPLRQHTTWNIERGEASVPSKRSAVVILDGLLGDGSNLRNADTYSLTDSNADEKLKLERALRRRLERMREPNLFHPIEPQVPTAYPEPEPEESLATPDVAQRAERRRVFDSELRKRVAKHVPSTKLPALTGRPDVPHGMKMRSAKPPSHCPGGPEVPKETEPAKPDAARPIPSGDTLAARARRMKKRRDVPEDACLTRPLPDERIELWT